MSITLTCQRRWVRDVVGTEDTNQVWIQRRFDMNIRKTVVVAVVLMVISGSVWADTGDQTDRGARDRGDWIENHYDRKGDRINRHLDRKSDRADAAGRERRAKRLDRKGNQIDRRLDRKGRKIDRRVDRRRDNRS